jgi:hypothetical protein
MILGIERMRLGAKCSKQFCAQGNIKLDLSQKDDVYILSLDIAEGWHINGAGSQQENQQETKEGFELLPTVIHSDNKVEYPKMSPSLNQNQGQYEGHVAFVISAPANHLQISFQACNDSICLAPETINLPPVLAI